MAKEIEKSKYLEEFEMNRNFLFNDQFLNSFSKTIMNCFNENLSENEKIEIVKELVKQLYSHINIAFKIRIPNYQIDSKIIYKNKMPSSQVLAYASEDSIYISNKFIKSVANNYDLPKLFDVVIHEVSHIAQSKHFPESKKVSKIYKFFDVSQKDEKEAILTKHFSEKLITNLNKLKRSPFFIERFEKILELTQEKYKDMPTMIEYLKNETFNILKEFDDFSTLSIYKSVYYQADEEKQAFFNGAMFSKELLNKLKEFSPEIKEKFETNSINPASAYNNDLEIFKNRDEIGENFWKFINILTPKELVQVLQENYNISIEEYKNLDLQIEKTKNGSKLDAQSLKKFISFLNEQIIKLYLYQKDEESVKIQIFEEAVKSESLDVFCDNLYLVLSDEEFLSIDNDIFKRRIDKYNIHGFVEQAFNCNRQDLLVTNSTFFELFTKEQCDNFLNWIKNNSEPYFFNNSFYILSEIKDSTNNKALNNVLSERNGKLSSFDDSLVNSFKRIVVEYQKRESNNSISEVEKLELSELEQNAEYLSKYMPKEFKELSMINKRLNKTVSEKQNN